MEGRQKRRKKKWHHIKGLSAATQNEKDVEEGPLSLPGGGRGRALGLYPSRNPPMQEGLRGMNSPIQGGPKAKYDIYRNEAPTPEPSTQAAVTPANRTACFARTELLSLALFPRQ